MATTAGALITWKGGRPYFTRAGLCHYAAASAECEIAFVPGAMRTAADLCLFLRTLLKASTARRVAAEAEAGASQPQRSHLQSLARHALGEVARSACDAAHPPQAARSAQTRRAA